MLNDKLTEICERLDWSIYLDANENYWLGVSDVQEVILSKAE